MGIAGANPKASRENPPSVVARMVDARGAVMPLPHLSHGPAKLLSHEYVEPPWALAFEPSPRAERHMRNARVSWW